MGSRAGRRRKRASRGWVTSARARSRARPSPQGSASVGRDQRQRVPCTVRSHRRGPGHPARRSGSCRGCRRVPWLAAGSRNMREAISPRQAGCSVRRTALAGPRTRGPQHDEPEQIEDILSHKRSSPRGGAPSKTAEDPKSRFALAPPSTRQPSCCPMGNAARKAHWTDTADRRERRADGRDAPTTGASQHRGAPHRAGAGAA